MTDHMSAAEYRAMIDKPAKQPKYKNKRVEVDGHWFDSKAEAKRYEDLKLMKQQGLIDGFGLQPSFILPGEIRYRADFIVSRGGEMWLEDVKGMATKEFKLKQKLWAKTYPWLPLKIIK